MNFKFSIIVPVYNRPDELDDLLGSLKIQDYQNPFQVVVVEDGSKQSAEAVVEKYQKHLQIDYFFKENSGPGSSRNFGMERATGTYFIILDSDCFLPSHYLSTVAKVLSKKYSDAYGGPDTFHASFKPIQKAISYAMTSFLTTGGLRGHKDVKDTFQLRSFNMGISKAAFDTTKGFSSQRFGEDIDLTFRLWKHKFKSQFIENAFVYHKRRSSLHDFFKQTLNFGAARPILTNQYPKTSKITYWFPSIFCIGLLGSLMAIILGYPYFIYFFIGYLLLIFIDSFFKNKQLKTAGLSVVATLVQFLGYGTGFLRSFFKLKIMGIHPVKAFPEMFR